MALYASIVRYFLSLAKLLVRVQCRVCEYDGDGDGSGNVLPIFRQTLFPSLVLNCLRTPQLTFQGVHLNQAVVPAILQNLSTPHLLSLEFRTDWSANFYPISIVH